MSPHLLLWFLFHALAAVLTLFTGHVLNLQFLRLYPFISGFDSLFKDLIYLSISGCFYSTFTCYVSCQYSRRNHKDRQPMRPHPLLVDPQTSIQPVFFPKDYRILLPPLTRVLSVNTSGPLAKVTKPVIPTHSLQGTVCTSETIYREIIISAVMYDLEVWTLRKSDENTLVMWERNILRKIFGPVKENGVCGSAPIKS